MAHLKVAACPFSIVLGSAVKLSMVGRCAVGVVRAGAGVDGGGGGGGGIFFLQPEAKTTNTSASIIALTLLDL
jgi:hypothetical protein